MRKRRSSEECSELARRGRVGDRHGVRLARAVRPRDGAGVPGAWVRGMSLQNLNGLSTREALQIPAASSTVKAPQIPVASSTRQAGQIPAASSTEPLSIEAIDRRRRKLGISLQYLLAEARVDRGTWYAAKLGRTQVRKSTLDRLDRALSRLAVGDKASVPATMMVLYRYLVGGIARESGVDVPAALAIASDFSSEKGRSVEWSALVRPRRLAIYLLASEFALGNANVAKAIGCTRQGVGKAIAEIEALRELDKVVDQLLARCVRLVRP